MIRKKKNHANGRHYIHLALLVISIVVAIIFLRTDLLHSYILHLGKLEYVGALVGGFFFVSTFTIAPASIVLYILAQTMPIWILAPIAGIGAMIGDFLMFQFLKDADLSGEISGLFKRFGSKKVKHLIHSRYFHWMLPVVGALIIISPLPDELGVSLMGISKLKWYRFLLLSFTLNTLGIFFLLSAVHVFSR
ncbi:MAG TPA: hypothetical protein VMR81_01255 [Patescibacteria group bacterium]|nr:hypothetical protein [Patescibacteria group bacterium]